MHLWQSDGCRRETIKMFKEKTKRSEITKRRKEKKKEMRIKWDTTWKAWKTNMYALMRRGKLKGFWNGEKSGTGPPFAGRLGHRNTPIRLYVTVERRWGECDFFLALFGFCRSNPKVYRIVSAEGAVFYSFISLVYEWSTDLSGDCFQPNLMFNARKKCNPNFGDCLLFRETWSLQLPGLPHGNKK